MKRQLPELEFQQRCVEKILVKATEALTLAKALNSDGKPFPILLSAQSAKKTAQAAVDLLETAKAQLEAAIATAKQALTRPEAEVSQDEVASVAADGITAIQLSEAGQYLLTKAEYHLDRFAHLTAPPKQQ